MAGGDSCRGGPRLDRSVGVPARARFSREASETNNDIEVVVLGAHDEQALEKTHSRYFVGPDLNELTTIAE
jgi:hypothetical protein